MDFVKIIGAIGENADKLGALGLLLLVNAAFLYALAKDKIVTGNRWVDEVTEHKETKDALKAANIELTAVKEALLRLQVEKELLWKSQPQPRSQSRTTRRAKQ